MKELEYPFDSEYIIKKRKSIKRTLLADGTKRLKKKIAVFGGSTTNDIVVYLDLFLLNNGIEAEFYQSEYAQYWQDAMFPSEELLNFKPVGLVRYGYLRNGQDAARRHDDYHDGTVPAHGIAVGLSVSHRQYAIFLPDFGQYFPGQMVYHCH